MTLAQSGNVGIGTTTPQATLDVNGSLHVANPSNIAGLMLNNSYEVGGGTTNGCSTPHSYKIATLVANNVSDYDHLHILVTVNNNWSAPNNSYIDAVFANRGGFNYQYTLRGAPPQSGAKLVAYSNPDTTVDIYLSFPCNGYGWADAGYSVVENEDDTVYSFPTDSGGTFSGTLVFDSSASQYSPATYSDYLGNLTLQGGLTLSGNGAGITFPNGGGTQTVAYTGVTCGGDYAESVDVSGNRTNYEPGDVLVIDPGAPGKFLKANEAYSTMVAGIYSTKPGTVGRRQTTPKSPTEVPMALVGIVPTKVSAENGPIKTGDLLVASPTLGHAMKGTDRNLMLGAVIGKALGSLDSGTGVIEVLVALQ